MKTEASFLILGGLILMLSGVMLGMAIRGKDYRTEAIEHGAARYNPTNANFEWIKP